MTAKNKENYLVIVESPAKAKTIGKILGKNYIIESSVGHIRDLPVKGIGVNTRKNFEPTYEIMPGKEKVVQRLLKAVKESDFVYIATDPDREGEAIAWHLSCILNVPEQKMSRVKFNEITENAIREAVKNKGQIDQDKVSAQQARRILDRLVGYKVSPLIQRKIGGRSAGRVQSVAVRLICEREEEIEKFIPQEYWTFLGQVQKQNIKESFNTQLISFRNKKLIMPDKTENDKNIWIKSKDIADEIANSLKPIKEVLVSSITEKTLNKQPSPPFITSTLQRTAASAFGFGVKKTMQIAQKLYEGIEIEGSPTGLITYMRTDSTRVSEKAQDEAWEFIKENYGNSFLPKEKKQYSKKKAAQDAHEAIRPTYIDKTPDSLKKSLSNDEYKLYKLIWQRFIASQMSAAQISRMTIELKHEETQSTFRASSNKVIFAGFQAAFSHSLQDQNNDTDEEKDDIASIPDLKKGDVLDLVKFLSKQHFTEPPPRYNEASLVKTLEELGIGRPSTYAATISTVLDRKYVQKNENKSLQPTKLGKEVNSVLVEHFGGVFETSFTAEMESKLDQVESANLNWQKMLEEFYNPFKAVLKEAQEKIESQQIPTDIDCPVCHDHKMVIKIGRFGKFLGCSNYPTCNGTMKLTKEGDPVPPDRESDKRCPKCETAMKITYGRFGDYLLCQNDECKHKMPIYNSTGILCYKENCKGEIVEKKSRFGKIFYGCSEWSNTGCDAVFWNKPIDEKCPKCNSQLTYKTLKRGDKIVCSNSKECDYERLVSELVLKS